MGGQQPGGNAEDRDVAGLLLLDHRIGHYQNVGKWPMFMVSQDLGIEAAFLQQIDPVGSSPAMLSHRPLQPASQYKTVNKPADPGPSRPASVAHPKDEPPTRPESRVDASQDVFLRLVVDVVQDIQNNDNINPAKTRCTHIADNKLRTVSQSDSCPFNVAPLQVDATKG